MPPALTGLDCSSLRADLLMAIGDPTATAGYREALEASTGDVRRLVRARLARAATMSGDLRHGRRSARRHRISTAVPLTPRSSSPRAPWPTSRGDLDTAWRVSEQARHRVLQGDKHGQVLELIALQGLLAHQRGEWFDRLTVELRRTREVPEVATALFDGYLCPAEYMLYGATPYGEVIELCRSLRVTAQRAGRAARRGLRHGDHRRGSIPGRRRRAGRPRAPAVDRAAPRDRLHGRGGCRAAARSPRSISPAATPMRPTASSAKHSHWRDGRSSPSTCSSASSAR